MKYYRIVHRRVWIVLFIVAFLMLRMFSTWDKTNTRKTVSNMMEDKPYNYDYNNKARLNVIILTHMSSGSTFVGNVFNFHPEVFYILEPLRELRRTVYGDPKMGDWTVLDKKAERAYKIDFLDLLRDIFTCRFQGNSTVDNVFPAWLRKKKTLDFLAWRSPTTQFTKESIREVCNSRIRRITVAKIMQNRLPGEIGIRELRKLCSSEPSQFDCLIIHLVRDPRAVISSLIRRMFHLPNAPKVELITPTNITREGKAIIKRNADILCSSVVKNLNYVNREWPNWFKNRYILVRYEDTVSDLSKAVFRLYNFTGLPMVTSISNWIHKGKSPALKPHIHDVFVISKEDVERIEAWRSGLKLSLVTEVEKKCRPLMKLMGYISVNNSERLLNDMSQKLWTDMIPLLETRPQLKFF